MIARSAQATKYCQFRLDTELIERLQKEADARVVSMTWLVRRLLEEGLDRLVPVEEFSLTRRPDTAALS